MSIDRVAMPDLSSIQRASSTYSNESDRFVPSRFVTTTVNKKTVTELALKQYFALYRARLTALTPRLKQRIKADYQGTNRSSINSFSPSDLPVVHLADLSDDTVQLQTRVAIIGVIVKKQAARPSVLKQLAKDANICAQPVGTVSYISDDDALSLEDEQQVILLDGNIDVQRAVTGVVCALVGERSAVSGYFKVESFVYPPIDVPSTLPPTIKTALPSDTYLLFMSGVEFTGTQHADHQSMIACQLLADYVTGAVSDEYASRCLAVVMAGNSCKISEADSHFVEQARYLKRGLDVPSVVCMQSLDTFLGKLTPHVRVDLMPGESDPTLTMLPQAPLHRVMMPNGGRHGAMLNLVSNPYQATFGHPDDQGGNLRILGTSGEGLNDVRRNSVVEEGMELLEEIYQWQHLAPTAPDTLNAWPTDVDPFIIEDPIDILFAGNQPTLQHKIVDSSPSTRGTLLLCLPVFAHTRQAAFVNTRTLHVTVIDCEQNVDLDKLLAD